MSDKLRQGQLHVFVHFPLPKVVYTAPR